MDKPLVSFCLKAYNQREYIGAALEGALGQTYRPLEIVICDDHSTDGTWEEIEQAASNRNEDLRKDGVRLVLHRNERNLGNCANWEMCGKLAHGELLIKADGDDISMPDRVEKVVAAWLKDGKRAKVITHAVRTIPGGRIIRGRNARWPLGAAMSWTRDCFEGWPEIGEDCRREFDDIVYSLRAIMIGPQLVMAEPLVRYRIGSGETTGLDSFRRPVVRAILSTRASIPQCQRDLADARVKGRILPEVYAREMEKLEADDRHNDRMLELFTSDSFRKRWKVFKEVRHTNNWKGQVALMIFLLPKRMGDIFFSIILRIRG